MDYYDEMASSTTRHYARGSSIDKSIEIENMEWNLGAKR
jgi:hypothetical protein